jgi:hypothetical protein
VDGLGDLSCQCAPGFGTGGFCSDRYTSLLGGAQQDVLLSVAVHPLTGDTYAAGYTYSPVIDSQVRADTVRCVLRVGNLIPDLGLRSPQVNAGTVDMLLIKLNSAGERAWTRLVGGYAFDLARGIAVDATNSAVYVTGDSSGYSPDLNMFDGLVSKGFADVVIVKYDTQNGTRLWSQSVGGLKDEQGLSIGLDADSNCYVAVQAGSYAPGQAMWDGMQFIGGWDVVLLKLNSNGTLLWSRITGSSTGTEHAYAIAVSPFGDAFIVGRTNAAFGGSDPITGGQDLFALKYDASGNLFWTRVMGSNQSDLAYAVALDPDGSSLVLSGACGGSLNGQAYNGGSTDAFVIKLRRSNGSEVWTRLIGAATPQGEAGVGLALDRSGNIFVGGGVLPCNAGEFALDNRPCMGAGDIWVSKLDSNGSRQWSQVCPSLSSLTPALLIAF